MARPSTTITKEAGGFISIWRSQCGLMRTKSRLVGCKIAALEALDLGQMKQRENDIVDLTSWSQTMCRCGHVRQCHVDRNTPDPVCAWCEPGANHHLFKRKR